MGKRKKNREKLEAYLFKHLDLDFERPIIIDGIMTNYTVTINGDIISYKGYNTDKPRKLTHMIVGGYHKVNLNIDGEEKLYSVHRLVATSFIPNPYNKPEVNHIDGNKDHNYDTNLEWATSKENIEHAVRTGLKKGKKGQSHPMSKIDEATAIRICELLETNKYSYKEIALMTASSYAIVKKIKNGNRWTHISSNYDFSNYTRKG